MLEHNYRYCVQCLCEPQLGKRGLYPTVSQRGSYDQIKSMTNFITYADGTNDFVDISNIIGVPVKELIPVVKTLEKHQLLKIVER